MVWGASKCPQNLSKGQSPSSPAVQRPLARPSAPASAEPAPREGMGTTAPKALADPTLPTPPGQQCRCTRGQPPRHTPSRPRPPAQHHLHQKRPSAVAKAPGGRGSNPGGPELLWGKPGPVSYGSLQSHLVTPRLQLCRERPGQAPGLPWTEGCGLLAPGPTWLPGGCQVNKTLLVMLL